MKNLKYVVLVVFISGLFTGCFLDDDNTVYTAPQNDSNVTSQNDDEESTAQTEFASDIEAVLSQNEDDEPLEVSDTTDDSSSFNTLL